MSAETKGPWHWSNKFRTSTDEYTWSLIGADGYGILSCDGEGNSPQGINDFGNARLIAASPDLYEALVACESALSQCVDALSSQEEDDHEALALARAALSRVKG